MEQTDTMPGEELPAPTGITLGPDQILKHLQQRNAVTVQNLQWELAVRDATIEALEERLTAAEENEQVAEGVVAAQGEEMVLLREQLELSRETVAGLVKGEGTLLETNNRLTERIIAAEGLDRDAFLTAPQNGEHDDAPTQVVPPFPT
jgi:hypothetical protein